MPTRSPVNDPGPETTANRSTSWSDRPSDASQARISPGKRSPCVRVASPVIATVRPSSRSARLPRRVAVSSARITIGGMLYSGLIDSPVFPPVTTSPLPVSLDSATPAMRQYLDVKRQHRDAIVFFRMGDFYEMFYEDALTASRVLELTLTSRAKDASGSIPMCGVPYHAMETYLARLVRKGYRVAICDQMEDARKAKGIVKREVTRVVSPGTLTDASYLDAREPAFLLAVAPGSDDRLGVALLDASTGEFLAAEYTGADERQALNEELAVLRPREAIVAQGVDATALLPELARLGITVTPLDPWTFGVDRATRTLADQLQAGSLHAFGLDGHPAAVCAAGALVEYLRDTQKVDLAHV